MKPVLEVKDLVAHFYTRRGVVRAVDGVSFTIHEGETVGVVGESGSGKTVCQLSYLRLLPEPPLRILGGSALLEGGLDLLKASPNQLRSIRGNRVSMIFQEPMTSLNPYLTVGTQLCEPLQIHGLLSRKDAAIQATAALERVGIADASAALKRYPHEFSGGMRQRVMIAMALTTKPKLLIADEPTTALDVTVQAQILQLLRDLQKETGMAILFITHDLGVIASIAHRVVVMYAGRVMERGTVDEVFYQTQHPYTQALLRSTPRLDVDQGKLSSIPGSPPDLTRLGDGCPFYGRCAYQRDACVRVYPPLRLTPTQHAAYCHLEGLPR
ncbi:ABC transporter ATP-binding protein [bacterium]|nr:ABC transporter ATP-binding protein [bacterium]